MRYCRAVFRSEDYQAGSLVDRLASRDNRHLLEIQAFTAPLELRPPHRAQQIEVQHVRGEAHWLAWKKHFLLRAFWVVAETSQTANTLCNTPNSAQARGHPQAGWRGWPSQDSPTVVCVSSRGRRAQANGVLRPGPGCTCESLGPEHQHLQNVSHDWPWSLCRCTLPGGCYTPYRVCNVRASQNEAQAGKLTAFPPQSLTFK